MSKVDEYHSHARHCMAMAAQTQSTEGKRQWLLIADTWLDLIPRREPTAADQFNAAIRQEPSISKH
jgi:hypothetical protein